MEKVVDDLLRCGICFDYFNIAMIIPQCSHNYCSLCIRKSLSYKTQCPTCCVAVVEPDLRNNRLLDELVKNFHSARQHLFQFILDSPPMSPQTLHNTHSAVKMHAARSMSYVGLKQEKKFIDSFLVKTNTLTSKSTQEITMEEMKVDKMEDPSHSAGACGAMCDETESNSCSPAASPEKPSTSALIEDRKVECPVCGVNISERFINKHLDNCLTREEKKESLRSSVHKRKPMAKVVYNLLSDRDLRKKLKDIGLSAQGPKQQLIKRHQEFVHMYNAQCDSLNPKSAAEIVKEIEYNEKTRALMESKPTQQSMTFTKDQTETEIDNIHSEYRKKHQSEFKLLVDQVKNRWGKKRRQEVKEEEQIGAEGNVKRRAEIKRQRRGRMSIKEPVLETTIKQESETGHPCSTGDQASFGLISAPFPSSPLSAASSSSDILRDLEQAELSEESLDDRCPEVMVKKHNTRRPGTEECNRIKTRSKHKWK
ncbi:E3 ubiquitin-protein ligase RAD18 isoform X3 [Rhinatrema bivittatum]|uniref:E3 ubiquitin-protein ligase RAD18 isoform X3 n=1 Tax=Rhinatrema bivittatum TaxID=194408 RepID=UPI00112EEAEA|nr:E3 ubiquitin-protein ligase RAD18 isoform X3 [Rhinatrema bivittatum]